METENQLRLADVFVAITDPRQAAKVEHDLVELLVVAVSAVLVGADTFVEIELWARERLDWLRRYLKLVHGIPSHDTFGRLFGRSPSMLWARRPTSLRLFRIAAPTMFWRSRTISPSWLNPSTTSGQAFAATRSSILRIVSLSRWKKIMDGWKRAVAMFLIRS